MFRSEKMEKLTCVVIDSKIDRVVEEIVKAGVLHLIDIKEIEGFTGFSPGGADKMLPELMEYERSIKELAALVGPLDLRKPAEPGFEHLPPARLGDALRDLRLKPDEIAVKIASCSADIRKYEDISGSMSRGPAFPSGFGRDSRYSFLHTSYGKLMERDLSYLEEKLKPLSGIVIPLGKEGQSVYIIALCLKKDQEKLEQALFDVSFQKLEFSDGEKDAGVSTSAEISGKVTALKEELGKYREELRRFGLANADEIRRVYNSIHLSRVISQAKGYFKKTDRTYLFSGWLPKAKRDALLKSIYELSGGRCYYENFQAENSGESFHDIPVLFRQPMLLRPFSLLVSEYGLPEYNTIDPTLFVAVSFLLMFGAMFGDAGHGLLLMAAGIFLRKKLKDLGLLVVYCGISSLIFGALFGSFFGIEDRIIPALWIKPMHNINYLFKIALYFGVSVISTGIVINIINSISRRDIKSGLFDKAGLTGGLIYWGGILIVSRMLTKGGGSGRSLSLWLMAIPAAVFFLGQPLLALVKGKKVFPEGVFIYFSETLIELLELFIGYLANTVSFIRVVAFGLTHVGLFSAIFSLMDIVESFPSGRFLSVLVYIAGNIAVIGLEGLVVLIQSVRLEYYEFFSKFYSGGGKKFQPVNIDQN